MSASLKILSVLACLAALAVPLGAPRAEEPSAVVEPAPTEPLAIAAKNGRHAFQVEVMRNDAQRAKGLMYRRTMAADHGMLFDFERPLPVNMCHAPSLPRNCVAQCTVMNLLSPGSILLRHETAAAHHIFLQPPRIGSAAAQGVQPVDHR